MLAGLLAVALAQAPAPAAPTRPARPPELFLASFPLVSSLAGPVDWGAVALRVAPGAGAGAPLPAFLARRRLRARDGVYLVTGLSEVASRDPVLPRHRGPSWVIDYDQPAFGPALEAARAQLGPTPGAAALTAFSAAYLARKDYTRGFDLASQVAASREGDCTEHAVFLAGLLRAFKVPARAVLGLLLLPTQAAPGAYGHMWVEAWVDGRWVALDAAVPEALGAARLPVGELEDEGPGYRLGTMRLGLAMRFDRLELLAADAR